MKEVLATLGTDVTVAGPEDFAAYVRADEKRLVPIIRTLGLTTN